ARFCQSFAHLSITRLDAEARAVDRGGLLRRSADASAGKHQGSFLLGPWSWDRSQANCHCDFADRLPIVTERSRRPPGAIPTMTTGFEERTIAPVGFFPTTDHRQNKGKLVCLQILNHWRPVKTTIQQQNSRSQTTRCSLCQQRGNDLCLRLL